MIATARAYLKRGWSLVPVASGTKRPLVKWEPFQERLASEAELEAWFMRWPNANIAIVTGALSGLVVLDIDPRHGGEESLEELERSFEPLPDTLEALTGGGGRHLYFRHPGGRVPNAVGLRPGLDLRGDGGLIVAPPSLHASGRRYEWEVSHHPDDVEPALLPSWLLGLVRPQGSGAGHDAAFWRKLVREGVEAGRRNQTLASLTGHLLWREVDLEVIRELLLCWNKVRCRPPLTEDEVNRTIESIERTHRRKSDEMR